MLSKIEILEQEIYDKKINVEHRTIGDLNKSFCIIDNHYGTNDKYIVVDKEKITNSKEYRTILLHELEHLDNYHLMYNFSKTMKSIKSCESRITTRLIKKYVDKEKLMQMIKANTTLFDISEEMMLSEDLIKAAYEFYKIN